MANLKRPLSFVNRTNYFSPESCRTHVRLSSPNTYLFRQSKIEGYETRLYWQYRYCEDNGYPVYYYTLTYNDKSLPDFFGAPCFDYEDLREFINGGFYKILRKRYGCTVRYFIGAELGEGAGKRGFRNNPHYHVLFFLEPKPFTYLKKVYEYEKVGVYQKNTKYHKKGDDKMKRVIHRVYVTQGFNPPSAIEFRHLVRLYWQGVDQDEIKGVNPRNYKYGIAQEGDKLGLVDRFNASVYCAKYVCKDARLQWFEHFGLIDSFKEHLSFVFPKGEEMLDFTYDSLVDSMVHDCILEFRNRYSNKCRISHGVGEYGLKYITSDYKIPVPDKDKGFKNRSLCLYYYRKLFTDVVKDKFGENLYVLNQKGIEYKCSQLESRISKLADKTATNVGLVLQDSSLYDRIVDSDVNISVDFDYSTFKNLFDDAVRRNFPFRTSELFRRFATYKLVYQDRFFFLEDNRNSVFYFHPRLNPIEDYRRFLSPSFYYSEYRYNGSLSFIFAHGKDWLSYDSHQDFCEYLCLFRVFDLLADYFFIQKDNKDERDAEERRRVRQFHVKRKLNFD